MGYPCGESRQDNTIVIECYGCFFSFLIFLILTLLAAHCPVAVQFNEGYSSVSFPVWSFLTFSRSRAKPLEIFTACTSCCTAAGRAPCVVIAGLVVPSLVPPFSRSAGSATSCALRRSGEATWFLDGTAKLDGHNLGVIAADSGRCEVCPSFLQQACISIPTGNALCCPSSMHKHEGAAGVPNAFLSLGSSPFGVGVGSS